MNSMSLLQKEFFIIAAIVSAVLLFRGFIMEPYLVRDTTMSPNLLPRDHIFVSKMSYGLRLPLTHIYLVLWNTPQIGDVIAFKHPEDERKILVRRVRGVGGNTVYYEKEDLYLNREQAERVVPFDNNWLERYGHELETDSDGMLIFSEEILNTKALVLVEKDFFSLEVGPLRVPNSQFFVMADNRSTGNDSRSWGHISMEDILGKVTFIWLSCKASLPVIGVFCHPGQFRWERLFLKVL